MKAHTFAAVREFNETLSMETFSLHESIKGKKQTQFMSLIKEIADKERLKRDDSLNLESSEKQCLSEGILECKLLLLQIHLNIPDNLDSATNIVKHQNKLKATCEKLEKKGNVNTDDESFIRMHDPESKYLHGKENYMKMVNAEGIPRKELGDLLRLRVSQYHTHYLYPLSRSMSNEMMRFSSLSTFPRHIDISMTRLARAGFFFTGEGCATKCYTCGTTYNQWKSGDDPLAIHKRISPSCILVNSFGSETPQYAGDSYLDAHSNNTTRSMNVGVADENSQHIDCTSSSPTDLYTGHQIMIDNASSVPSSHASTENAARNIPTSDITGETGDENTTNRFIYNNHQSSSAEASGWTNPPNTTYIGTNLSIDSIAVKSVREFGYTEEQVVKALEIMEESGEVLTARNLLKIVLDGETTTTLYNSASIQAHKSVATPCALKETIPNISSTSCTPTSRNETETIFEENQQFREQRLCKVCLDLDATMAFLPCGHIVCCNDCALAMRKCPICRKYIEGSVKIYFP